MAELQLIIDGATSEDDDAYVITSLAQEWGSRLLEIAELKLFKDGKEMVDKSSVPQGVDPNSASVGCGESGSAYQRKRDRPSTAQWFP